MLTKTTKSFIQRATALTDENDYMLLLLEYLNVFKNGHTLCTDPTITPIDFSITTPLGFCIEYIENNWTIAASLFPEVYPGNRLMSINEDPIDIFVHK